MQDRTAYDAGFSRAMTLYHARSLAIDDKSRGRCRQHIQDVRIGHDGARRDALPRRAFVDELGGSGRQHNLRQK